MLPFVENLNTNYLEAYAKLLPKDSPKPIVVYVEAEEDIAFWRNILHPYQAAHKVKFEIKLPSNTSLNKGKNAVLANVTGEIGTSLLLCVDSDYDYLLEKYYIPLDKKAIADRIKQSKYIFQTYSYSIENLKCYADSLHGVCVTTTLNDTEKIDFNAFFEAYSILVYPLLLWNLLFYSKGEDEHFSITSFCELIKIIGTIDIENQGKNVLQGIESNVNEKLKELTTVFPTYEREAVLLGESLKIEGLNQKNAYLFVQGHTICDNVALMLLKPICRMLKTEWLNEINERAKDSNEKTTNIGYYEKRVGKVDTEVVKILANNTKFENCFLYKKITNDIEDFFSLI
jgi:hypothetical protein